MVAKTFYITDSPAGALAKLRSEDQGLFDQIKSFVDQWVTKLREFLRGGTVSEEGKIVANLEKFEQIQQMFMEAMDVAGKNFAKAEVGEEKSTTQEGDAMLSGRNEEVYKQPITDADIVTLRSIGRKSINDFTVQDLKKAQKWAYKFFKDLGVKSPFIRAWFGDWRENSTDPAEIVSFVYGETWKLNYKSRYVVNNDMSSRTQKKILLDGTVIEDSLHYAKKNGDEKQIRKLLGRIDEILEKGILLDTKISERSSGNKKGSTQFMHYLYTPVSINGAPFIAKLAVEEYDLTEKNRAYNLQRIQLSALSRAQFAEIILQNREKYAYSTDALSVSQLHQFVKNEDNGFNPKSSSKIVNFDGTPKVMYHGTNYDFTVFDKRKAKAGAFGKGFYFSPSKSVAGMYGTKNNLEVYLKVQNPYVVTDSLGFTAEEYRKIQQELNVKDRITDSNVHKILTQNGFDGIMVYAQNGQLREVVVFDSSQIKSATDNIGTFDGQNDDIYHSLRNEPQDNSIRGILSRIDAASRKTSAEREHLGRYQDRLNQLKDPVLAGWCKGLSLCGLYLRCTKVADNLCAALGGGICENHLVHGLAAVGHFIAPLPPSRPCVGLLRDSGGCYGCAVSLCVSPCQPESFGKCLYPLAEEPPRCVHDLAEIVFHRIYLPF